LAPRAIGRGNLLAADGKPTRSMSRLGRLQKGRRDDTFLPPARLLYHPPSGKLYATSNVCTHRGATVMNKQTELVCPKHNSHFSLEGTVTQAKPAARCPVRGFRR